MTESWDVTLRLDDRRSDNPIKQVTLRIEGLTHADAVNHALKLYPNYALFYVISSPRNTYYTS